MATTNPQGDAMWRAARAKGKRAADSLLTVALGIHRSEQLDPGRDASAENVAKARRENWNNSGSGREREGEKK